MRGAVFRKYRVGLLAVVLFVCMVLFSVAIRVDHKNEQASSSDPPNVELLLKQVSDLKREDELMRVHLAQMTKIVGEVSAEKKLLVESKISAEQKAVSSLHTQVQLEKELARVKEELVNASTVCQNKEETTKKNACQKLLTQERPEIVRPKDLISRYDLSKKVLDESPKVRETFFPVLLFFLYLTFPQKSVAIHIVTHVHWDREWYRPFEQFNRLLATIMDTVVATLRTEKSPISHFHLDSQSILVEDYLRARPDQKGVIKALADADKLGLGPW
jgi:hypothetical protein